MIDKFALNGESRLKYKWLNNLRGVILINRKKIDQ